MKTFLPKMRYLRWHSPSSWDFHSYPIFIRDIDICLNSDKIIRDKMEGKMLEWTGEPDEEKLNELMSLSFEEKEKIAMDITKDSILNVLHIDTTVEFDNIYLYIEKMRKLWRFNLVRERRGDIEDIKIAENKEERCKKLIIESLKNAIEK